MVTKSSWANRRDYHAKVGRRVKLSGLGLLARGLTDRGFNESTRGVIMESDVAGRYPDSIVAVYVHGSEGTEMWGSEFWEEIEE